MDIIKKIEQENMRMDMPAFRSGDTVKVHLRIVERCSQFVHVVSGQSPRQVMGKIFGVIWCYRNHLSF